jgi:hypothetical protein
MHPRSLLPAAVPSVDPDACRSGRCTADRAADVADFGERQTHQAALFEVFGTFVYSRIQLMVAMLLREESERPSAAGSRA